MYSEAIFNNIKSEQINDVVLRYSRRRIDRNLKKVDLSSASSVEELSSILDLKLSELNISAIYDFKKKEIDNAIENKDLYTLLKHFDNKGLLALAATNLKGCKLSNFEQWLSRILSQQGNNAVKVAIRQQLPNLDAR
ncbi:hypothetical protein ACSZM7_03765 [Aeromonas veronii]